MCDTNVKEKKQTHVQMKDNKKHMSYGTNENDGHFPNHWTKDQWLDKLNA
jgi:hypothetical protein